MYSFSNVDHFCRARNSSINIVHPKGLCLPSTETAGLQDRSHLVQAGEQVTTSHEPGDTFRARRRRQAAIVGPVLVELGDVVESKLHVQVQRLFSLCLVPMDHRSR